jgi:hypothetical protein
MRDSRYEKVGDAVDSLVRAISWKLYWCLVVGTFGLAIVHFATGRYGEGAEGAGIVAAMTLVPLAISRIRLRRYKQAAHDHPGYGTPRF